MAEKLSALEKDIVLKEHRKRGRFQRQQLRRMVRFFLVGNISIGIFIAAFALLEHFLPLGRPNIITDKVLISAIGGITLQTGAIIVAAFKGLFGNK